MKKQANLSTFISTFSGSVQCISPHVTPELVLGTGTVLTGDGTGIPVPVPVYRYRDFLATGIWHTGLTKS